MAIQIHKKYAPLYTRKPKTRYYVITGGRASGKSFAVTDATAQYLTLPKQVILFTRYTMTSARLSIIPEFEEKLWLRGDEYAQQFVIDATQITIPATKSKCIFSGIKTSSGTQTARLKGIKNLSTWVFDEAEEMVDYEEFQVINETIRAKNADNRVIIVMNPSHKEHFVYKEFVKTQREDTTFIHTTYLDNVHNLSESYLAEIERTKQLNPKRYRHIFLGEWLDEAEGVLWNNEIIELCRVYNKPKLKAIVVAIDPAITANENSDETGIVVCGIDHNGVGYVLDDVSGKYSPGEWAKTAKLAADKWGADKYVAEKNQGGDMVKHIIRQNDQTRKIKMVTATKGKLLRAEPIYSLYEQGKVKHLGNFAQLEKQMLYYTPKSKISPDRLDAMVWGMTDLLIHAKKHIHVLTS